MLLWMHCHITPAPKKRHTHKTHTHSPPLTQKNFPNHSPLSESCSMFVTVWEGPPDGANDHRMKGTPSVCV